MRRRPPFTLVEGPRFQNATDSITWLAEQNQSGRLLGFAFIAMTAERGLRIHSTGEMNRNPRYSRGLVASMDDLFRAMIEAREASKR